MSTLNLGDDGDDDDNGAGDNDADVLEVSSLVEDNDDDAHNND